METFEGKVAIITGSSGTLGSVVAEKFFHEGMRLVLVHLHEHDLPELFRDKRDVLSMVIDLSRPDAAFSMAQNAIDRFGRIDILANIAGGFTMGTPVHETPMKTFDFMLALNAGTVLHASSAVIPSMRKQRYGKIVNVAAGSALSGKALMAPYIVSKSAVIRLTESLAAENRDFGINVNCVLPSIIDSPQNRLDMPDADFSRWVAPDALADVISFLASDASRALHGASIPVSGLIQVL
jgi:NAD(P)-dependent dehydrogenase (short-subunit alcohol dehydrogenase family)